MYETRGRVLVVSADVEVMRQVARIAGHGEAAIDWVAGAREAIGLLDRSANDIVMLLADQQLADGSAFDVFRYVRRDPDCPYPGIALALSGEALSDGDMQRSAVFGCVHFLRRPFCPEAVAQGLAQWPLDRTDFIVSGSYSGPDRRRASRQEMVERQTLSGPAEQTVASTSLGFEIRPSTTVFRFRRLPAAGPDAALALRNGLTRDTVEPARSHVRLKQEQALAMLGHTRQRMEDAYLELEARPGRQALQRLNALAHEAAALTETRGLLLVGTIVRGLIDRTDSARLPAEPLLGQLRAQLDALADAIGRGIDHGVADDPRGAGEAAVALEPAAAP